jgi:hypothetical protein
MRLGKPVALTMHAIRALVRSNVPCLACTKSIDLSGNAANVILALACVTTVAAWSTTHTLDLYFVAHS